LFERLNKILRKKIIYLSACSKKSVFSTEAGRSPYGELLAHASWKVERNLGNEERNVVEAT
jgi:hypothetical protein